jgi:hypothetical protein
MFQKELLTTNNNTRIWEKENKGEACSLPSFSHNHSSSSLLTGTIIPFSVGIKKITGKRSLSGLSGKVCLWTSLPSFKNIILKKGDKRIKERIRIMRIGLKKGDKRKT